MILVVALLGVAVAEDVSGAFPTRLKVGNVTHSVDLSCEALPGQKVHWEVEDEALVEMEQMPPWGHRLRILNVDLSSAKNYTCWGPGGELLDSVVLAVQDPESPLFHREAGKAEAKVTCEAQSYNGHFSCSWKTSRPAAVRAHLRRKGLDSAICPSKEVAAPPGKGHILLEDCSFCPFAEQQETALEVELEGLGEDGSYENLRRELFLWDIVKPDFPRNLTVHRELDKKLELSWAPPESWHPSSTYFPLHYHLKLEYYDGDQKEANSDQLEETIEDGIEGMHCVQIRCQDPFSNLAWSPWSPWARVG
ncbi:interleukin-12 subunit beta-like [Rhineura floridana]|uniref:interleukin-12 subunit beta-like n=1 Tax=Rhineura floridana TaxID=261503 RepID=UPI002AC85966|nr:interleukin-12 subunit beta-like [Rhineura floridana]